MVFFSFGPRFTSYSWLWLLFLPATVGLMSQVFRLSTWDQRLLVLGFSLLSLDQARMALVDLEHIRQVKQSLASPSPSLHSFAILTWITIVWEVLGFYWGILQLGTGILLVLSSQVWFNALASIRLIPAPEPAIEIRAWKEKILVLLADALGITLMGLWLHHIAPLTIVVSLWAIALVYGGVKLTKIISEGHRAKTTEPEP
jgi:putative effector of murein hydrolase LrgA (UPF0299 family)